MRCCTCHDVQTKLLQMSQDLKIECLVNCLRRNKFITNYSSDFKRSRLLWASPLILSLRIFLQFHLRLWHFIFGSYLRPSLIMPLFFPKASSSNILAMKSDKIAILSFCLGWIFQPIMAQAFHYVLVFCHNLTLPILPSVNPSSEQ